MQTSHTMAHSKGADANTLQAIHIAIRTTRHVLHARNELYRWSYVLSCTISFVGVCVRDMKAVPYAEHVSRLTETHFRNDKQVGGKLENSIVCGQSCTEEWNSHITRDMLPPSQCVVWCTWAYAAFEHGKFGRRSFARARHDKNNKKKWHTIRMLQQIFVSIIAPIEWWDRMVGWWNLEC